MADERMDEMAVARAMGRLADRVEAAEARAQLWKNRAAGLADSVISAAHASGAFPHAADLARARAEAIERIAEDEDECEGQAAAEREEAADRVLGRGAWADV